MLEIAEPQIKKRRDEFRKLERLAATLDVAPPDEPPPPTEEQKARVSALVKETVAGLKATSESLRPRSTGGINRGQPPSEDGADDGVSTESFHHENQK